MPDWAVQQIRASLFSSGAVSFGEAAWTSLTGQEEAENRISIPSGKQYSGKFLDGVFNLAYAGSRADILLVHDDSTTDPMKEPTVPAFGQWDDLSERFIATVAPFIEGFDFPVVRMAFGAVVLFPCNSREESYKKLAEMLRSLKVDPAGMRELNYRVNWPRQSEVVKGLELNRLTTWTSLGVGRATLQVMGAEMAMSREPMSIHSARLEIDHNTSQTNKEPFEKDQRVPILRELFSLARDNVNTGEHP